ncbi:uncharacterized protein K452DRAFT_158951 [Aplosporella prunicola CBS 121167]|uniref:Uncharacterized protein n=1 Tax=Aplosporella prunicola CBS 121167 TaxID=1176127 RepID=A0A6A6AW15_9PEZI|nr:uncharacterized protein K452DRAFT_158951 [Aplosporella prunicola CBS 121167]KAF2135796.1 hypothetical protein K452DRAFT_158951 [Aplosporella prunicola CBS 121167]
MNKFASNRVTCPDVQQKANLASVTYNPSTVLFRSAWDGSFTLLSNLPPPASIKGEATSSPNATNQKKKPTATNILLTKTMLTTPSTTHICTNALPHITAPSLTTATILPSQSWRVSVAAAGYHIISSRKSPYTSQTQPEKKRKKQAKKPSPSVKRKPAVKRKAK